jgi:hypothetical protein
MDDLGWDLLTFGNNRDGESSALDGRTTRPSGYAVSQRKRTVVEEICGWMKTVGLLQKTQHRGVARIGWMFTLAVAVYNFVRADAGRHGGVRLGRREADHHLFQNQTTLCHRRRVGR